jgi:hypothetical protein
MPFGAESGPSGYDVVEPIDPPPITEPWTDETAVGKGRLSRNKVA